MCYRDYNKDVDLLRLSQDIKDVFKYISMWVSDEVNRFITSCRPGRGRFESDGTVLLTARTCVFAQVLSSKGETGVQTAAVHTGLLARRRRRRRVYQSDRAGPRGAGGPRPGVPGRAVPEPERPVSVEFAAAGVVFVVVKVAGEWA